jgi:hypothetical protein
LINVLLVKYVFVYGPDIIKRVAFQTLMYNVFGKSGFLWCNCAVTWSYACESKRL